MFRQWLEGVSSVIPSQCALCRRWPAEPVCGDCTQRFAIPRARCTSCALPLETPALHCTRCKRRPPPLATCIAAVDYGYPWDDCIAEFKFRGQPGWAGILARLMMAAPGARDLVAAADLVVPMPLAPLRLRERGFNQALELVRHLPVARSRIRTDLLLRIRDTPAQSSLDRSRRLANMRGAFAVEPLSTATLEGRRILLVDDVMTSGASLHEAASQLRSAGAANVSALVIARTDEAAGD